jgi:endoglucanase
MENQSRRSFIKIAGLAGAAVATTPLITQCSTKPQGVSSSDHQLPLPKWKGFNLQYIYRNRGIHAPEENHFKWIADWGFDFVRIPLNYRAWLKYKPQRGDRPLTEDDVYNIDESTLELIDKMVEYGVKHNIHVNLCFHQAPGYIIGITDRTGEPFRLFRDKSAEEAFTFHWELFAKRYKGISDSQISFNLFNEAPWPNDNFNGEIYKNGIAPAVKAIRDISPGRIILADGSGAGNLWVPELVPLKINQSVHCYIPGNLSHYKVDWMQDQEYWPEPQWPGALGVDGFTWDRSKLEEYYKPWQRLVEQGIGVHMGETSGSHRLPHGVFLAWLEDVLSIFSQMGIGYAIWDFIGASNFGILDSNRADVQYEDWYGHKLDRKMLSLLQRY